MARVYVVVDIDFMQNDDDTYPDEILEIKPGKRRAVRMAQYDLDHGRISHLELLEQHHLNTFSVTVLEEV